MAEKKTTPDLAEVRTDFAEDRTVLANERTLASWLRTGFAAIGIGLAFNALFERVEPAWLPKAIATAFLAIAMVIFRSSERRACAVLDRLATHSVQTIRPARVRVISWASLAGTMALIAAIWFAPMTPPG